MKKIVAQVCLATCLVSFTACKAREFNRADEQGVEVSPNGGVKISLGNKKGQKGQTAMQDLVFGRFARDSACWYLLKGGPKGTIETLNAKAVPHNILRDNLKPDKLVTQQDADDLSSQFVKLTENLGDTDKKPAAGAFKRPAEAELTYWKNTRINLGPRAKAGVSAEVTNMQQWFGAKLSSLQNVSVSVVSAPAKKDNDISSPVTTQEATLKWEVFSCPEIK